MRKVLIGIVAGLALAAGSARAAGHPAVDDFKAMCLATAGDPAKAVALAENAGWLPQDISALASISPRSASSIGPKAGIC